MNIYSIDVKDILRNIIDLYDNNADYYCCEKHYQMFCEENTLEEGYQEKQIKYITRIY